MSRKGRT
jgi:hypothetical protein